MSVSRGETGPRLALDVGGANIKAAHESGAARSIPFPLWKRPRDLPAVLAEFVLGFEPFARVALTMTAELCDCYATKSEGVQQVLDATAYAARGRPVDVWGIDSRFHNVGTIRCQPILAAASNWLALARVAAVLAGAGPGLLIDVGSTTTDLIPLLDGLPVPAGLTDSERLRTGELVYVGVRRTPLCALAARLPYRDASTRLAAELFATTLDVYLTLGEIPPDPSDLDTADGRPATPDAALGRLARMVGADSDTFDSCDALTLATEADRLLIERLESAAHESLATIGTLRTVVISGSGEFLARRLAARLVPSMAPVLSLRSIWGSSLSSSACAHALLILARDLIR